mmetsp:Transcript_51824/g.91484  ORF Transcript_51824/g.91484 Transcript_51824/m.91484 type:complete len:247 (-) Transcript_51824:22-762(-)
MGTPVTLAMRARICWMVGSPSQYGTLHQDVALVRTAETPSPASERSKWCPPFSMRARTSCSRRKSSTTTTHGAGGRERTRSWKCGESRATKRSKVACTPPGASSGCTSAVRWQRRRPLATNSHESHALGQLGRMKPGLASHSRFAAHCAQLSCRSTQSKAGEAEVCGTSASRRRKLADLRRLAVETEGKASVELRERALRTAASGARGCCGRNEEGLEEEVSARRISSRQMALSRKKVPAVSRIRG